MKSPGKQEEPWMRRVGQNNVETILKVFILHILLRVLMDHGEQTSNKVMVSEPCIDLLIICIKINRMLLRRICKASFAKLKKQEILSSGYNELVDKMVDAYGFKEYQIPSALSLLEIHHHFTIFRPGNWVLDIGAGPFYSWTSLALKLTQDLNKTHLVVSNDLNDSLKRRENNVLVRGDFCSEPVQTKIALSLQNRLLNIILIDATLEEYTGVPGNDASHTMDVFYSALNFSNRYLQKGGTIVMRTQECVETLANEHKAKFLFNEVHRYKPSNVKGNCTNFFYIMKGFMMTARAEQAQQLLESYKGSRQDRQRLVNKCKQLYDWDPVLLISNQAKQAISELKQKGQKNSSILKMYENDPFVNAKEIVKSIDILNDENAHPAAKVKARYKILYDYDAQKDYNLPESEHQFAHLLVDELRQASQHFKQKGRRGKKDKGQPTNDQKAPLAEDQIYMGHDEKQQNSVEEKQYRESDYFGYETQQQLNQKEEMLQQKQQQDELTKLFQSFTATNLVSQSDQQGLQSITAQYKSNKDRINKKINSKEWEQDFRQIEEAFHEAYPEMRKEKKVEDSFEEESHSPNQDQESFHQYDSNMSKIDFMSSKPAKANRYVNQRRSSRKNPHKKKF